MTLLYWRHFQSTIGDPGATATALWRSLVGPFLPKRPRPWASLQGRSVEGWFEVRCAKLVFVGDASTTRNLSQAAQGADALVIEATYLESERDLAADFGHLTARQSAQLARDAQVSALVLTHLSRRHYEREVLAEARSVFGNTFVARDFDLFQIAKGGKVTLVRADKRHRSG